MSQEINIEIVVLKIEERSESDRRIIALTQEAGKQSFIAKGARKSGSRLSALTQPFTRARVSVAVGKKTKFITQCELVNTHSKIRSDYDRLLSGFAVSEICLAICQFDKPAEKEFELLIRILEILAEHPEPKIVFLWGVLKFIYLEGICPHWIPEKNNPGLLFPEYVWFSLRAGGIISAEERKNYSDFEQVPISLMITLDKLGKLDLPPMYIKELHAVLVFIEKQIQKMLQRKIVVFSSLLESY